MKVKDLITKLQLLNPDAVVKMYNADYDQILQVNSLTFTETEVELFATGEDDQGEQND